MALWPGATRNPAGRFGPGIGEQNGVAPGHGVDFPASEFLLVLASELGRCNQLQRVPVDRDAEREADLAFFGDGLTRHAFWQHKKS